MTENLNGAMELDGEPAENDLASDQSIVGSDEMDSDSDDTAQQEEWKRKKQLLEEKIKKDKTDYYAYVELIDVLKSLGELDELRKVRESFSAQYPLTPELWLSWIEDERNLASSPEEKQHVQELFERALQDYLSVDIWLEYAQYSIGLMSDNNHVETVRSIMERSLSIAGLHASKGKLLWEVYREFEMIVLLSLKEGNPSGEDTEAIKTQKKRIGEIMRRQLSVPLMDMEGTYQEVRQWFDEEKAYDICDMEAIESGYKKALDKLSRILTFEESLLCSEIEASLSIYQNYLEFEKRPSEGGNDLFRVKCLYERALTDHPLNASLWRDYIQYLSAYAKVPEDILSVCYRAVRNCPSEGVLWKYYMVELERCNKPKLEITEIFNKSLENVYTNPKDSKALWLSYIYYLLRQLSSVSSENEKLRESNIEEIRAVFNMASENLVKYFGAEGDPECDILQLWARFEAETAKDLESYRKLWTNILDFGYKTSIVYWTKYINMEWQYGDAKHLRRLCERALTALVAVPECPSSIVTLWTEFESLKGSLDSFVHCQRICDEKMKQYNAERGKIKERFNDKKNKNPVKDKKKIKGDDKHVFAKPEPKTSENKGQTSVKTSHSPSKTDEPATKQKKPNTPVETAPPPGTVPAHDSSKDDRTVFISNLDYTVTEEDVKKILSEVGTVEEFRLVRDFKGRSKGYGYMVFSNKNEAVAALKKDRTPVNQRPMFISECDPDRQTRKTGLRFNTGLEKNKLFVKGLPLNLNKEDIENIFKPYGTLVDVRLVTYRNGHSKGLAYVEFENETSAAHALLKTDGLEIGDKTISVAISNPPERKNNASLIPSISEIALGGGSSNKSELGQRGRGRTQLSFIPRAVQVQPSESNDMDVSNGPATTTDKKPATNEDFRNAIFGNKTKTKNIF